MVLGAGRQASGADQGQRKVVLAKVLVHLAALTPLAILAWQVIDVARTGSNALLPLAITSTKGWIRRLGRKWALLHKLVYVVGILAVLHFWWLVKSDIREPLLYAGILAVLLGWRAWKRFDWKRFGSGRRARRTG